MAEEEASTFTKKKLGSIAPIRRTSVEDAFDSNESEWSETDEEDEAKKPKLSLDKKESDQRGSDLPTDLKSTEVVPVKSEDALSLAAVIDIPKEKSEAKEEVKVLTIKADVTKDQKKDKNEDDDDDNWDDESELGNVKPTQTMGPGIGMKLPAKIPLVFQPQHVSSEEKVQEKNQPIQKQDPVVDWSPSESFAVDLSSEGEDGTESIASEREQEEKRSERGDGDSLHKDAKTNISFETKTVDKSHLSKASIQPEETIAILEKDSVEVVNLEEEPKLNENMFRKSTSPAQLLPTTSSAAHLFTVPSSPPEASHSSHKSPKKKEKKAEAGTAEAKRSRSKSASSGKGFFQRFLSSDTSKPSKKESQQSFVRKSSEPAPLSTLLLDTPIKSIASLDNKGSKDFLVNAPHSTVTTKRSRSRASSASGPSENELNFKHALVVPGGAGKQKSLMGRIKKTFGVRSKSKFQGQGSSPSNLSVPENNLVTAISDPCISTGEDETPIIAVQTKGRPAQEVFTELMKEVIVYLENSCQQDDMIRAGGDADTKPNVKSFQDFGTLGRSKTASEISLDDIVGQGADAGKSGTEKDKMAYYCSQADENANNQQILQKIMQDFICVVNKSFGTNEKLQNDCTTLFMEIERLQHELEGSMCCRTELERKLQELQQHNQQLQFCMDEECQSRQNLEQLIQQLKEQLSRQDGCLNVEVTEKTDLISAVRQLEVDTQNYKNQISDLEVEREELQRMCRGFEGTKDRCSEYKQALAQCCQQCDNLQKELFDLRQDYRDLEGKMDKSAFEHSQVCKELEFLQQKTAEEKSLLEGQLCTLQEANAALEKSKVETCEKMNDVIKLHHEELNKLQAENDSYKDQLDELKKRNEELEKRLRDCEEQKKQAALAQQNAMPAEEVTKYKSMYEAEKSEKENLERKLKESEEKLRKNLSEQQKVMEQELLERDKVSQVKIENLKLDLVNANKTLIEVQRQREDIEKKLRESEEKKLISTHEQELQLQKQQFHSQQSLQKLDNLQTELNKFKEMYNEEKRFREDAERRLKDLDEQKQRSVVEQQLTLQLQNQQQELLSKQSQEIEKYKAISDEEKKARQDLEQKLRALEDEKLKNMQEHQQSIHHLQQQQDFYSQQKVEVLKNEIEKYKLMYDEEKRMREDIDRKLRNMEEQHQKTLVDHQEALRKQQEYYSQLASAAKQQTEEEKVARELWQRELRDAQRLWESEVKAKGILAEKLAKFEKQQTAVVAQTHKEQEEIERYKEKIRFLKLALKSEKDLVVKITNKLDDTRTLAKNYKHQVDEVMKDPKTQKLMTVIESLKSKFELHSENARQDKEKLMGEIYRLDQEKWKAEREAKRLGEDIKIMETELSTWKNLAKMKDRIELEFVELKRAINDQYIDKRDVEKLKNAYEGKLAEIKAHYEKEVQKQVTDTLFEYTNQIGRQTRDRTMLDKIRDVNENTLRTELTSVTRSMQQDIDNLRSIIRDRDEQIVSLRKSLEIVKDKYSDESRHRESLMKRLQLLSSQSQEALLDLPTGSIPPLTSPVILPSTSIKKDNVG